MNRESFENQTRAVAFTDDDDDGGLVPAIPAATLIIFHESGDGGQPRLLMVRRATTMAFAAGAAVFPGGRVDPDDHVVAQTALAFAGLAPADGAARVAAIRETLEETGLVIGLSRAAFAVRTEMRASLLAETPLSQVLAEHRVTIDPGSLIPFSRWRPNFAHSRTFDTRFFLASLSGPVPDLAVEQAENSELFWIEAQSALDRGEAGDLHMIFPTQRNIERLALYANFAEARRSTEIFPPRRITPWIDERDGVKHLCIREDCGYPITSEPMQSAMRG